MHLLFVHQNFPAQFGHIARHLVSQRGWACTFVSLTPPGEVQEITKIQYKPAGGAGGDPLLQPDVREQRLARPWSTRSLQFGS